MYVKNPRAALLAAAMTLALTACSDPQSTTAHRAAPNETMPVLVAKTDPTPQQAPATSQEFNVARKAADTLRQLSHGQSEAVEFFDGPDGLVGLVGYNRAKDNYFIAWTTRGGEALIIGPVLQDGRNLTDYYQQKVLGTPGDPIIRQGEQTLRGNPETKGQRSNGQSTQAARQPQAPFISERMFARVKQAPAVTVGQASKHLYLFYDAFCHYCARAKQQLEQPVADHQVQVTYIPVAALGMKSRDAAAALLDADDRQAALQVAGGLLAKRSAPPKAVRQALDNTELLGRMTQRVATPTFVMVDKQTGKPYFIQGLPRDMGTLIAGIKEHDK